MNTVLVGILIISGIVTMISILLMSPKGGLGFGIGGAGGSNEYGSKKSIEFTLKRVAFIGALIFIVVVVALPLINVNPSVNTTTGVNTAPIVNTAPVVNAQ